MFIKLALLGLSLLVGDGDVRSIPPLGEFEGWFRSAAEGKLEIPEAVLRKGRSFRYVFVGGFRNERIPGYFSHNIAELRDLGISARRIHVIRPSSSQSSEENADEVKAQLETISEEGPERLVIIAHSRGACDALAFALTHPSFVETRVEALFLIQGPFGGSGVAEYLVGDGPKMDRRMKLKHRILANLLGRLARMRMNGPTEGAVEGMTRTASKDFWARTLEKNQDAVPVVSPKTYYVRSVVDPSRLRFARRVVAWYVQIYHGRGDGVVALADQSLPGIGSVIATVEAAHADLTQKSSSKRRSRELREALSRSIVMAVGQPKGSASPETIRISPELRGPDRLDLREDPVPERKSRLKRLHRRKSSLVPE